MSLPAGKALRRLFPDCSITYWISSGLAPLVQATKIAQEVICFNENSGGPLRRPFHMRERLMSGRFDMVVLFQNAFESAFTSWLARIPVRAGYPTDLRGLLLTLRVPLSEEIRLKHQVYYYLAITDFLEKHFLGENQEAVSEPDCSIELGHEPMRRAKDLLVSLHADPQRPVFCLCPGSVNSEAKRWPLDYYARLGDLLHDEMLAQVVFLGSPGERDLIEEIQSRMRTPGSLNLAAPGDMITSMAVMGLSAMVISNDTGSAHLAVAASSRVLTIFGPTSAGATAPYGPDAHVIQGEAPCAPCRHFRCPRPDHLCMRSIEPEAVLRKVAQILSESSPKPL